VVVVLWSIANIKWFRFAGGVGVNYWWLQ